MKDIFVVVLFFFCHCSSKRAVLSCLGQIVDR